MLHWRQSTIQHVNKYIPHIHTGTDLNTFLKESCQKGLTCAEIAKACHLSSEIINKHCHAIHACIQRPGGYRRPRKTYRYKGEEYTLLQLLIMSSVDGLTYNHLYQRLETCQWSIARALTTPIQKKHKTSQTS